MLRQVLRDPKVRQAYITTKVGVFFGAAALTWPLSKLIGDKAWVGLAVFGLLLMALAAAVLGAAGPPGQTDTTTDENVPSQES